MLPKTTLPNGAFDALTPTQQRVILHAYKRGEPYFVCPTPGLGVAPQTSVLRALRVRGYITESGSPTLTHRGRAEASVHLHNESVKGGT
jgi:hypothetical protein